MLIYRLVYQSKSKLDAFSDRARGMVDSILDTSRTRNAAAGITGALIFNETLFTQILEGDEQAVKETFSRIQNDKRHSDIKIIYIETGSSRRFGAWSMAFAGKSQAAQDHYRNIAMNRVNWYGLSDEPIIQLMLKMISIDEEEISRASTIEKLGQLLTLIARRWRDRVNTALEPLKLSAAMAEPLLWLNRGGGAMRQGDLAGLVGIESHSLTRIINQLKAKKLIEQRDDASDRRVKIFQLTEMGSRLAAHADEDLTHMRLRLLRTVSAGDVKEATRILSAIERGLIRDEVQTDRAAGR